MTRPLMLVSASASGRVRSEVESGQRPRPEYLELERRGVELLDWSRLPGSPSRRSPVTSAVQVAAALPRLRGRPAVFSDGENVGIPLALGMRAAGLRVPHLMLGHHLTNGRKPALVRRLRPDRRIDRILVHSPRQVELAVSQMGLPAAMLAFDPYYVDTEFWQPPAASGDETPAVVSAGREHRDYATLAAALDGQPVPVVIASGSTHSPSATTRMPEQWPETFQTCVAAPSQLRDLYARASIVVVPVVESDFQAGITVVLEAMSMAKPVVASAASGWSGVIEDGADGLLVQPGDPDALRSALLRLVRDEQLRRRLGAAARKSAVEKFGLGAYCDRLLGHLGELSLVRVTQVAEPESPGRMTPIS